jgi:hypothetical protein
VIFKGARALEKTRR